MSELFNSPATSGLRPILGYRFQRTKRRLIMGLSVLTAIFSLPAVIILPLVSNLPIVGVLLIIGPFFFLTQSRDGKGRLRDRSIVLIVGLLVTLSFIAASVYIVWVNSWLWIFPALIIQFLLFSWFFLPAGDPLSSIHYMFAVNPSKYLNSANFFLVLSGNITHGLEPENIEEYLPKTDGKDIRNGGGYAAFDLTLHEVLADLHGDMYWASSALVLKASPERPEDLQPVLDRWNEIATRLNSMYPSTCRHYLLLLDCDDELFSRAKAKWQPPDRIKSEILSCHEDLLDYHSSQRVEVAVQHFLRHAGKDRRLSVFLSGHTAAFWEADHAMHPACKRAFLKSCLHESSTVATHGLLDVWEGWLRFMLAAVAKCEELEGVTLPHVPGAMSSFSAMIKTIEEIEPRSRFGHVVKDWWATPVRGMDKIHLQHIVQETITESHDMDIEVATHSAAETFNLVRNIRNSIRHGSLGHQSSNEIRRPLALAYIYAVNSLDAEVKMTVPEKGSEVKLRFKGGDSQTVDLSAFVKHEGDEWHYLTSSRKGAHEWRRFLETNESEIENT